MIWCCTVAGNPSGLRNAREVLKGADMTRTMSTLKTILISALTVGLLVTSAWAEEAKTPEPADETGLVAMVNADPISTSQVDRELSGYQQKLIRAGKALTPESMVKLRENVVESLIDRSLLYQESVREGIAVSDEEVQEQWSQLRQRFTSEEAYQLALKRMQMDENQMRDEIRRANAIRKLIDKFFGNTATISDEEALAFYKSRQHEFVRPEEVQARHILLRPDPKGGEEAKQEAVKKLQELRKNIVEGKDFAELARSHSQCPSAEKGGDLGFFSREKMAKPFSDAAFALQPGELSDVVETQFGYHLIKLEERRPEGVIPFEEVRDGVVNYLSRQAVKEAVKSHLKQLRQEAQIKRFDQADESGVTEAPVS